jgi:acyl carrier protein
MEDFYRKLADILEVPEVKPADVMGGFAEWDSLSILSVIAWLSSDYEIHLHASELWEISTAQNLQDLVVERRGQRR